MTADRRSRIVIRANAILARAAVGILPALAALFIGSSPTAVRADLVMEIQNSSAPVGGVGAFDVLLVDNGGTFAPGGFSFEITTGSGITFTGATTSTVTASYVFGTFQSTPAPFATLNSTTDLFASDTYMTAPGSVPLSDPNTVGLARVTYAVDPGATPGMVPVSFVALSDSLSDVDGFGIPFTTSDGTITINSIPEPMSLVSAVIGITMVGAGLILRARRRRA